MFCPKCGNQISENDRYCYRCGYVINGNKQQADEPEYSYSGEYGAVKMRKGRTRKKNTSVSAVGLIMVIFALIVCAAAVSVVINPDLMYIGRPQYAALKVCRAVKNSDFKEIARQFNGTDDSVDELISNYSSKYSLLFEFFDNTCDEIDYEVISSSVSGNKATVTVRVSYLDYSGAFGDAIAQQILGAFGAALSGVDVNDYLDSDTFLASIVSSVESSSNFRRAQTNVKFSCVRDGIAWRLDYMPDDELDKLLNIVSCGFGSVAAGIGSALDTDTVYEDDDITYNFLDVPPKQSMALQTINFMVKSSEEKKYIRSDNEFIDDISAPIGTKFIIVKCQAENITKGTLTFTNEDLPLLDSLDRQYYPMDESLYYFDDAQIIFELAPNIKTAFTLVYNVPDNSTDCYIAMANGGTSDVYCFYVD